MRRRLRFAAIAVAAVMLLAVVGAVAWTRLGPDPTPHARAVAAEADDTGNDWFAFGPDAGAVGIIMYPGARIDAEAYAPVARALGAEADALVVVVDAPLDLALLDVDAADAVRAAHPSIDHWIVGGHSLGGVAAARYVARADTDVSGLLLWAGYPADGDTIADDVAVTSITGTRDLVLDRDAARAARVRLPADAAMVELEGVTHAQFGDYGEQPGDGTATVSDVTARRLIARASAALAARVRDHGR